MPYDLRHAEGGRPRHEHRRRPIALQDRRRRRRLSTARQVISVAAARAVLLGLARPMPAELVRLEQCLGRTLATPVVPARAQPPFAASAMDGYAVRSADTPGRLRVVGEAGAGHAFEQPLGRGECARIFTGAPLPGGADAIAIQEDVEREGAFA
ncbi:MAG: hypothetical protein JSS00_14845, partial [Proteobacteria bacterium]|nr:hypothetical protein [Pseudomonadota bacterium]